MKIHPLLKPASVALACLVALVAFVGCASTPPAQGIKAGMTKKQVIDIAGKPQSRQTMNGMADSSNALTRAAGGSGIPKGADEIWSYNNMARNLIPFVGIASGMHMDMVTVYFRNGKVVSQDTSSNGLW